MALELADTPGFKLFRQRLVETTHTTFARIDSHKSFCNFSHLLGARPARPPFVLCRLLLVVHTDCTVQRSGCGTVRSAIPGHLKILDLPRGRGQVTSVAPIAVPFPF